MSNEKWNRLLQKMRLGDKVETAIGLVPLLKKRLKCYDAAGNLIPESRCGGRKAAANGEPRKEFEPV